jgi:hypothetical protein
VVKHTLYPEAHQSCCYLTTHSSRSERFDKLTVKGDYLVLRLLDFLELYITRYLLFQCDRLLGVQFFQPGKNLFLCRRKLHFFPFPSVRGVPYRAGQSGGLTACSTSTSTGLGTSGNLFEGLFSGSGWDRLRVSPNLFVFADGMVPPTASEIRQVVFLAAQ